MPSLDSFKSRRELQVGSKTYVYYDLKAAEENGLTGVSRLPFSLKVILETSLLTDEEIVAASLAAKRAGADFVKTSTAFTQKGATVEAVALMRRTVGAEMGVKASGGIRSFAEAMAMVEAGANRIGTSRGVALMREAHFGS